MHISFSQGATFVCGAFILISEFLKAKNNLFMFDNSLLFGNISQNRLKISRFINTPTELDRHKSIESTNDDEEEHFVDAESDSDGEKKVEKPAPAKNSNKTASSWQHNKNMAFKKLDHYDYHERNPLYSGADKTVNYELLPFTRHYHPTVVVFANKLLNVWV